LWLAGNAVAATKDSPNIILITLDTVRADRMGFLGSERGLTPNLDALARQSVVFTRAYSQVPLTAPSHATILTGTYPQYHQVRDFQTPLGRGLPYAPEILQNRGYQTAAFIGAMVLDPGVGLAPGFDRGFDTYDAGFHQAPGEDRYRTTERRGGEVVDHALAWLGEHAGRPLFMWVHLYDAHDPYDPPEPFKTRYAAAPYDGEIAYVDFAVGKLIDQLRVDGVYEGSVIAVMADHGESLGEHGEAFHGFFLYDETIHVPLMIKLPGEVSAGNRNGTRVELVDVLPTILQAAHIAVPREVQGESLLDLMKPSSDATIEAASPSQDRPAYAETEYAHLAYGWSSLRALRSGKYLYVEAPRSELYDQSVDLHAQHDLSAAAPAVLGTLAGQLNAFLDKTSSVRKSPQEALDPEAEEKLAALGYAATIKSAGAESRRVTKQGADPKDTIEIGNIIHRANMAFDEGHLPEAVSLWRQLIAKEPSVALFYNRLSQCLVLMKDYRHAVPVLRKLLELSPNSAVAHFKLGTALFVTEDFAGAVTEFQRLVEELPQWQRGHILLANAYTRAGRIAPAIKECNKVLATSPDDYDANLLLGRVLTLSGKPDAALANLKKAAALRPNEANPHYALRNYYLKLGKAAAAASEQAEANRLSARRP
jgi:arylsulfatase A-like enzyme/Flp pilus assembly protein TadD